MKTLTYYFLTAILAMLFTLQADAQFSSAINKKILFKKGEIQGVVSIKKTNFNGRVNTLAIQNFLQKNLQIYNVNLGARPVGLAPANYNGAPIATKVQVVQAHTSTHFRFNFRASAAYGALPMYKPILLGLKNNNAPYGLSFSVVYYPLIAALTPQDPIFKGYNFSGQIIIIK